MRSLEHRVHEAGASRRVQFDGGVAFYNDDLPLVWDVNFVRVDTETEDVAGTVERLQADMGHRKVLIEDALLAEAYTPELEAAGLKRRGLVAMARRPEGSLDPDVREVSFDAVRPLRFRVHMEQLMPPDEAVATQLGELHGRAEQRWLVIHADGEAAGQLVVYAHDGLAQIEDVAVLRRFQGCGLARRLIGHALALLAQDHDTVFITADADDWPRELYARLGFEHVEDRADFLLIKAG